MHAATLRETLDFAPMHRYFKMKAKEKALAAKRSSLRVSWRKSLEEEGREAIKAFHVQLQLCADVKKRARANHKVDKQRCGLGCHIC